MPSSTVAAHFTAPPFQDQELKDRRIHRVLNSYDVMDGPLNFTVLWTTSRFKNENPALYRAFVAALKQANDMLNADKRAAARIYVEESKSKESVDEVHALLADPTVEFSLVPRQIHKYALFMHENGQIRQPPASWKEIFFDDVHALPGS